MQPRWSTACPDWEDRFRQGKPLTPIGALFPEAAEAGMAVFRDLFVVDVPHPEGLSRPPRVGEICRPWIMEIAEAIHGAYDRETGERLIREVLVKVPKKNWKSGFAGMLMLSLLVLNWRQSNEAGIVAPTKDTADNVFKPMRDAIKADPELAALFHVLPTQRTIRHRTTGMECRVYAADTETVSGKKWAFVIFEELWQLAKRAGAEDMVLECSGGQSSRPEGIVISISTESDDEPMGVYAAKLNFARQVRDGEVVAPYFLPILYEWPKAEIKAKAYLDPAKFPLVNPNWGASVDPIVFMREYHEARAAGGKSLQVFLAKKLNVPPSENMGGAWAGAEFWNAGDDDSISLEEILKRSDVITIGIDGGGLDDMLGFAVMGRDGDDWLLWTKAWVHPIAMDRHKGEAELWKDFQAEGSLGVVKEVGAEIAEIADMVERIEKSGLLDRVGVDPAGIGAIVDAIAAKGIDREKRIVGIPQGWKLNGAIKTFERKLGAGEVLHRSTALMRYSVSRARTQKAGNAVYVTREKSGTGKVDPLLASFNAGALMGMNPQPRRKKFQMFVL